MKKFLFYITIFCLLLTFQISSVQAFTDLPDSHKHYFALTYLQDQGIIDGYPDGSVKPDNQINRAELVKILVEGLGYVPNPEEHNNCFPDVTNDWYAPYVCFAKEQNWIQGYPDNTYKPEQPVNKVEAIKIILNAYKIDAVESDKTPFNDVNTNDWYAPFLNSAVQKNYIEETSGYFSPTFNRTRGEIAEMVSRILMVEFMGDPTFTDNLKAEFQTFMLLNQIRKDYGVEEELILNPILTKVAREHSKDMA